MKIYDIKYIRKGRIDNCYAEGKNPKDASDKVPERFPGAVVVRCVEWTHKKEAVRQAVRKDIKGDSND